MGYIIAVCLIKETVSDHDVFKKMYNFNQKQPCIIY